MNTNVATQTACRSSVCPPWPRRSNSARSGFRPPAAAHPVAKFSPADSATIAHLIW